jgi:sulfate transport system permease protein
MVRSAGGRHSVLPGFRVTLGFTVLYLVAIVLVPLSTLPIRSASSSWAVFIDTVTDPRVLASFRLSLGAALVAACINAVFGALTAWVLVRYTFPGRRLIDALIDLPFALPTAVAGITLTAICAPNGWVGAIVEPWGIQLAFTPAGVTIALIFIGLPFVIRT